MTHGSQRRRTQPKSQRPRSLSRSSVYRAVRRTNGLAHCGGPSPSPRSCSCSPLMIAIRAPLPTGGRWRGLQSPSRRPGRSDRRVGATSRGRERKVTPVSRYGMGMSLAQLPAAWMAPRIEARLGPGASQPLFLIVPLLCVCAAAAAAGWIALGLGLSAGGVAAAGAADGSRLSSWILRITRSVRAAPGRRSRTQPCVQPDIESALVTPRSSRRYAFLAGAAAGIALLTKSSLAVAIPFALLPLLSEAPTGARSRIVSALAGLALPFAGWIYFEIARFGRLFASYAGEGFTHPWLDGFWRLLAGPNRGLGLYFPALVIAMLALVICYRQPSIERGSWSQRRQASSPRC